MYNIVAELYTAWTPVFLHGAGGTASLRRPRRDADPHVG